MNQKVIPIQNENKDICTPCGGQCCKSSPGSFMPNQILKGQTNQFEIIDKMMDDGLVVINQIDIYPDSDTLVAPDYSFLVLQPTTSISKQWSTKTSRGDNFGQCVNLTETGCSLRFDERPYVCQQLIPVEGGKCHYDPNVNLDEKLYEAWLPHQQFLNDLYDHRWDIHAMKIK